MSTKKQLFGIITAVIISALNFNISADQGNQLKVKAKTQSYNGKYKPSNCVMMWIQKADKTFIKSIYKAAYRRVQYCTTWDEISGNAGKTPSDKEWDGLDATTSATRTNHNDTITAIWDCTDKDSKTVANGSYEFWIEMTEDHDTSMVNHGIIEIGGESQTVKATAADNIPFLEASFIPATSVKKRSFITHKNGISFVSEKSLISIELPQSGNYSVTLVSAAGREITAIKGNGLKAVLPLDRSELKAGVYLVKISQSGNTCTLPYLKGF